jgi:hypothetical protein
MKLIKQLILNRELIKDYQYSLSLLEKIRDQINQDPRKNIGLTSPFEKLEITTSDMVFKYSNAVVENGSLYVDIETVHTPKGVDLRRAIETNKPLQFRFDKRSGQIIVLI